MLFGPPRTVYAEVDRRRPSAEVDDDVFVALEHDQGVRSHLWMSVLAAIRGPRMRLLGVHAAFEKFGLDVQEQALSEGARPGPKALNFSFYRNPRLDDVLIRASQLASRQERARLYQRGQGLLADDMPWLPIYVRLVWGVARPEVHNLRLHPTGFHRLSPVALDQ